VAAYRSAVTEGLNTLIIDSGRLLATDDERRDHITQNRLSDTIRGIGSVQVDGGTTYFGVPHGPHGDASFAKLFGVLHHFNYAIYGRPENWYKWDKLSRVKRTFIGVLEYDGATTLGSATIDLTAALADNDWVRFEGIGARVHRSRVEVTARAGTGPWSATIDLHGEVAPQAGQYRIWKVEEDQRLLADGAGVGGSDTWVWNGTTSVVPTDATTEAQIRANGLTEGMAIYLGSDVGGVNGEPRHLRVTAIADDLVTIEDPMAQGIPNATGATYMASPLSYACMHDAIRSCVNDGDEGDGVIHGDAGPSKIARPGGTAFGDTRTNVVTPRISPGQQAMADSALNAGPGVVNYGSIDHNDWTGLATVPVGEGVLDKVPLDDVAIDADGNFVGGSDGTGLKCWHGKHGFRQTSRETFLKLALASANLTASDRSVASKPLFNEDNTEIIGVEYVKIHADGKQEVKQAFGPVISCMGKTADAAFLLRGGVGTQARMVDQAPVVELPGVGANNQSHIGIAQVWLLAASEPRGVYHPFSYVSRYRSTQTLNTDAHGVGVPPTVYESSYDVQGVIANFEAFGNVEGEASKRSKLNNNILIHAMFHYQPPDRGNGLYLNSLDPMAKGNVTFKSSAYRDPIGKTTEALQEAADFWRLKLGDPGGAFYPLLTDFSFLPGPPTQGLVFDDTVPIDGGTGLPLEPGSVPAVGHPSRVGFQHAVFSLASHMWGTVAIGADDDPWAVLDERFRLRDGKGGIIPGYRCLSLATYPEPIAANTKTTTMALAWRGMDLIADDGAV